MAPHTHLLRGLLLGCRIPLGYIFESNVVEILLRLFPQPAFRNLSLQCLSEVRPHRALEPQDPRPCAWGTDAPVPLYPRTSMWAYQRAEAGSA